MYLFQYFLCFTIKCLKVHQVSLSRQIAKKEIFRHTGRKNHIDFLKDHLYAIFFCILYSCKLYLLPAYVNLSLISAIGIRTAQNLHQSGFSCPVFTTNAQNFSISQLQIYVFQSSDTGELFYYMPHFQKVFSHYHPLLYAALLIF